MDIRALKKRDKMRRAEIKDLIKQVSKLTHLLRKREAEIKGLKREIEVFDGILETLYLICRYGIAMADEKIIIKTIVKVDKIRAEGGYTDGNS